MNLKYKTIVLTLVLSTSFSTHKIHARKASLTAAGIASLAGSIPSLVEILATKNMNSTNASTIKKTAACSLALDALASIIILKKEQTITSFVIDGIPALYFTTQEYKKFCKAHKIAEKNAKGINKNQANLQKKLYTTSCISGGISLLSWFALISAVEEEAYDVVALPFAALFINSIIQKVVQFKRLQSELRSV